MSDSGAKTAGIFRNSAIVVLLAVALLVPALWNRFPLIFPDSGIYLAVALGHGYAIDRSSFYGLFLKPLVALASGETGLWVAIAIQALLVALVLWGTAKVFVRGRVMAAALLAVAAMSSISFHAGQFMPDAFTGPCILLAWLAARRDPSEEGAGLLWIAVTATALVHYTHLALAAAAVAATLASAATLGVPRRSIFRRAVAAAIAIGVAATVQVEMNSALLQQPRVAPMGPVFLYARLNEDGLIKPWLDRHCGRDAPEELCRIAPRFPRDSQRLLWGEESPAYTMIWGNDGSPTDWKLVEAMDVANKGAIAEAPLAFAVDAAEGATDQFLSFAPLDDECPKVCRDTGGKTATILGQYRPETVPALDSSAQVRDTMPKAAIRAILTPIAVIALLLLPVAGWAAWRRRDRDPLTLVAAVTMALVANAAVAGALSDVHDRYQSRIVWLAPLAIILLAARWRREVGKIRLSGRLVASPAANLSAGQ